MNWFEKNEKCTLAILLIIGIALSFLLLEGLARFYGLGHTVVYQSNAIFGYRPGPDQDFTRNGKHLHFNNLGLRSAVNWDTDPTPYVLFLGDSITYGGSYVDNSELFSTLAVADFPDWIAGNAGVNAWGVLNVAALVQETGFTPAHIYISVFPEEDFERGLNRIGGAPFWVRQPHSALEELFFYGVYKLNVWKNKAPEYPLSAHDKYMILNQAVSKLKAYDSYLRGLGHYHRIYITPTKAQALGLHPKNRELALLFGEYDLDVTYLGDYIELPSEKIPALYHDMAHLSVEGHRLWGKLLRHDLAVLRAEMGLGLGVTKSEVL